MRLLALNGSPRRGGNTDILLAEFVKGAESAGAESKLFYLNELDITPCQHCDYCLREGSCRLEDDMQLVHAELEKADGVVLASPIYFLNLTAQMKAAVDRCQVYWARKYRLKVPPLGGGVERRGFFLSVAGRSAEHEPLFEGAIAVVKTLFRTLNITYAGELLVPEVEEWGAIRKVAGILERAYEAGKNLVLP